MDFTYDAYKLFATDHKLPSLQGFVLVKVLIGKMSNLGKLDESRQKAVEIIKKISMESCSLGTSTLQE
jgi:hypothetical protein